MILSDRDIAAALDEGRIEIDAPLVDEQFQPASIDLRIGHEVLDVTNGEVLDLQHGGTFTLEPWTFYLGTTLESVTLPDDLVGDLAGRSSFAREGLIVHLVAGYCDPGWSGQLTLEMLNVSADPIDVDVCERVVQIAFHEMSSPSSGYDGNYQGQRGPTESRRDREEV